MITQRYVKRRSEELEVVRLTKENIEEVAAFIGRPVIDTVSHGKVIGVRTGDTAQVGDYLCRVWKRGRPRFDTSGWFSFGADKFEEIYEEAF